MPNLVNLRQYCHLFLCADTEFICRFWVIWRLISSISIYIKFSNLYQNIIVNLWQIYIFLLFLRSFLDLIQSLSY